MEVSLPQENIVQMMLDDIDARNRETNLTLDDKAWGAASDVVPKFVSLSDPAAQWTGAHKGPAFFAYSDNYLIDVKFGVQQAASADFYGLPFGFGIAVGGDHNDGDLGSHLPEFLAASRVHSCRAC